MQLHEQIELLTVHRAGSDGDRVMDHCGRGPALTVDAFLLNSLDADVLCLPTCSRGMLCARTTTIGCNHWATVVATQVVVRGHDKTHRAAMRKASRGYMVARRE